MMMRMMMMTMMAKMIVMNFYCFDILHQMVHLARRLKLQQSTWVFLEALGEPLASPSK